MSDIESDPEVADFDELELGYATWTTHSEVDVDKAHRAERVVSNVKSTTTNEFIIEAVNLAAMLRNTLGDADGVVADATNQIIANLTLVSTEIHKDPCGFMLSFIRAIEDDDDRKQTATQVAARLTRYVNES